MPTARAGLRVICAASFHLCIGVRALLVALSAHGANLPFDGLEAQIISTPSEHLSERRFQYDCEIERTADTPISEGSTMTNKDGFTLEERREVLESILAAGLAVSAVDPSGPVGYL